MYIVFVLDIFHVYYTITTYMLIENKYEFLGELGRGAFAIVYKARNKRTNALVAIKKGTDPTEMKLLKNEIDLYSYLKGGKGIPIVIWHGIENDKYYMVITLLGSSLTNFTSKQSTMNIDAVVKLGKQMIQRISYIHGKLLLHRDVKPDNFLFERDNVDKIYLIDFGLSKFYIREEHHIPFRDDRSLLGSMNYVSINVHHGIEPSRRDDLESLVYIMYYLWNGCVEWNDFTIEQYSNYTDMSIAIANKKIECLSCDRTPLCIRNMFTYCRNLGFDETPDYIYLLLDIMSNNTTTLL